MKLLIVDDSSIIRRAIERCVGNLDFEDIYDAANGVDALNLFELYRPEVVTMDITMPEMDGLLCVEHMVKIDPNVKILVVSALADRSTAVQAVMLGAEGFLLKPVTAEDVEEAFIDILELDEKYTL